MTETQRIPSAPAPRKRTRKAAKANMKHGFYTSTFTPDEIRRLDAGGAGSGQEKNLLRVKILRLAKLTPLKKIETKELEALIKLTRVVAVLDALERTGISARKVDGTSGSLLDALDEMDPDDL
jgi:hypothetical protein